MPTLQIVVRAPKDSQSTYGAGVWLMQRRMCAGQGPMSIYVQAYTWTLLGNIEIAMQVAAMRNRSAMIKAGTRSGINVIEECTLKARDKPSHYGSRCGQESEHDIDINL